MKPPPAHGWILYDDSCGICRNWVFLWQKTLLKHGYEIAPLQAAWVREKWNLPETELLHDVRLLLRDGTRINGTDVYRHALKHIWWAYPVYLLSVIPVGRQIFDFSYRKFADNRHRFSRSCRIK